MPSRSRQIKVLCPECQAPNPFTQWEVVDAAENPEAVDAIVDGSLFEFTCRNCEEEITLDFSVRMEDHSYGGIGMVQYDAPRQVTLEKPPAPKPWYKLRY